MCRLRRNGLTESVLAIDHCEHGRVEQHVHRLISEDQSFIFHLDIARYPHNAVTIVAGQVRTDQVSCDAIRFRAGATGSVEDIGYQPREVVMCNRFHALDHTRRRAET